MKVSELIEALLAMPQDADVRAEQVLGVTNQVTGAYVDWRGDVTIEVLD